MSEPEQTSLGQHIDLDAVRQRIENGSSAGGCMYPIGLLRDLAVAAQQGAESQMVPAEFFIGAVSLALDYINRSNETLVPLSTEAAAMLLALAIVPSEEQPDAPDLRLIA